MIPVTWNLIQWADFIIFVEQKNYDEVLEKFSENEIAIGTIKEKAMIWNIPDNYEYMERMLVFKIKEKFQEHFLENKT